MKGISQNEGYLLGKYFGVHIGASLLRETFETTFVVRSGPRGQQGASNDG